MGSLLTLLEKKKLIIAKGVAKSFEEIDLPKYMTSEALHPTIVDEPFPHVVIDNFFKPDIYSAIEKAFLAKLAQGLVNNSYEYNKFHTFDIDYDGYKFCPKGSWSDPNDPLYFFYSIAWNDFFSKLFTQPTTINTSLAFHHHPPGDKTGFVHHDLANKYFDLRSRLPSGAIPCDFIPSSSTPLNSIQIERRIIAILFYVANPTWNEGDGGETGLYSADKEKLLIKVPPVNNRLLAFHISNQSMHAFQTNKLPRNCIVQWFHIPEALF